MYPLPLHLPIIIWLEKSPLSKRTHHPCSFPSSLSPLTPAHLSKQLSVIDSIIDDIICWFACCCACVITACFCSGVKFCKAAVGSIIFSNTLLSSRGCELWVDTTSGSVDDYYRHGTGLLVSEWQKMPKLPEGAGACDKKKGTAIFNLFVYLVSLRTTSHFFVRCKPTCDAVV